jgi:hypothetical protein
MSADTTTFGPLAEPIHPDAAGPDDPPWRDNAYLAFWSDTEPIFGQVHVSTSPNDRRRFARIGVCIDDHPAEFLEPLEPGTFTSPSIEFDLAGRVRVDSPELTLDLHYRPRFTPTDYLSSGVMGGLVRDAPLQHFEQGCDLTGSVQVKDRSLLIQGKGFRDRTWGFREESKQWVEWLTVWACFETFDLTALKILGTDGRTTVDGFVVDGDGQTRVTGITYTYTGAGRLERADLTLENGGTCVVTHRSGRGGLWLPVGPDGHSGPVLESYAEFPGLESNGQFGRGLVGYGVLRQLH